METNPPEDKREQVTQVTSAPATAHHVRHSARGQKTSAPPSPYLCTRERAGLAANAQRAAREHPEAFAYFISDLFNHFLNTSPAVTDNHPFHQR